MINFNKTVVPLNDLISHYVKIECFYNSCLCGILYGKICINFASLIKVDIESEYRFKGIGRKLVQEFETISQERKCSQIKLISKDSESDKFWNAINYLPDIKSYNFYKQISH